MTARSGVRRHPRRALVESDSSTAAMRAWRRAETIFSWLAFFAAAAIGAHVSVFGDGRCALASARETARGSRRRTHGGVRMDRRAARRHRRARVPRARRSRSRGGRRRARRVVRRLARRAVRFRSGVQASASILPAGPSRPSPSSRSRSRMRLLEVPPRRGGRARDARRRETYVANGYGLFRRMTGGARGRDGATRNRPGGERRRRDVGTVDFAHKPGALDAPPTWVAPHQPRLDWQMWFAALGSCTSEPVGRQSRSTVGGRAGGVGAARRRRRRAFRRDETTKFMRGVRYAYDFTGTNAARRGGDATRICRRRTSRSVPRRRLRAAFHRGARRDDVGERIGDGGARATDRRGARRRVGSALAGVVAALDALATRFMFEMVREGGVLHGRAAIRISSRRRDEYGCDRDQDDGTTEYSVERITIASSRDRRRETAGTPPPRTPPRSRLFAR